MIYRYELYCDDEYQGVGFMQGLLGVFGEDRTRELCYYFDKHLKIPKYLNFKEEHTCAFFTELGILKFKNYIKYIIIAYEEETIYDVKCIKMNKDEILNDILYEDEYQVIIKESAVHKKISYIA